MFDSRGHQPARIDHDNNALVSFDLILFGDQAAASRSGGPGDMPKFIAADVITEAFELPTLPAQSRFPLAGHHLPVSPRGEFMPFGFPDVRINLDALSRGISCLPDSEPPGPAPARDEISE